MRKPVLPYANNKGADQPVHPRCLVSVFAVGCLDSIMSILAEYYLNVKALASFCSLSGRFESYLVAHLEDRVFLLTWLILKPSAITYITFKEHCSLDYKKLFVSNCCEH